RSNYLIIFGLLYEKWRDPESIGYLKTQSRAQSGPVNHPGFPVFGSFFELVIKEKLVRKVRPEHAPAQNKIEISFQCHHRPETPHAFTFLKIHKIVSRGFYEIGFANFTVVLQHSLVDLGVIEPV